MDALDLTKYSGDNRPHAVQGPSTFQGRDTFIKRCGPPPLVPIHAQVGPAPCNSSERPVSEILRQKCPGTLDKRSRENATFLSKLFVIPQANPKFVPSASQFLLNKKSGFGITEVGLNLEDDEEAVTRKIEMAIPVLNKVRFRMYVRGNAKSLEQCDKHVLNGLELFEFKRKMIYLAPIHDLHSEIAQHRKWPPVTDPPKNETSVKDVPFHSRAIFERLGRFNNYVQHFMKPGTRVIHIEQHNIGHFVDTILDNYDFLVIAHHRLEVHFIDQSVDKFWPERVFFEKALYYVKEKLTTFEDDADGWLVSLTYGYNRTMRERYWKTGGFLAGLAMAHCHLFPAWVLTYFKRFRCDQNHPFIQGLNFFGIAELLKIGQEMESLFHEVPMEPKFLLETLSWNYSDDPRLKIRQDLTYGYLFRWLHDIAEGSIFDQFGRVNVRDVFQFVTGYRFPSSDWQPGCVKLTFFPPDAKSMPRPTARICSGVEEFKLPIVEDYQTFKQLCIEALVNAKKYQ